MRKKNVKNAYVIQKLVKGKWVSKAILTHTKKGRLLKNENDAVRHGWGCYGSRPRLGQATAKSSGARYRAVKVDNKAIA